MKEVKYIRWKAMVFVAFGASISFVGAYLCSDFERIILGIAVFVFGALLMHVGRLRLRENDVLLRLTPEAIWTKEFGWQPWNKMVVELDRTQRAFTATLEIHRPNDATPRFFEYVSHLTISENELRQWLERFASNQK
ncbi:hypothetical protein [Hymenobacter jejuensis]|uniref:Uncharacterized protein n=1 Tax=Hymenobacter jejuensis TaxID=2502781 RepID=A0A5B7ZYR1_9BACT|nr:hypothetical protein [Hymenobacter jejuensis]QDA59583.1 hypothetical protein FHG12_05435 [Hymenobacter jejuensis]